MKKWLGQIALAILALLLALACYLFWRLGDRHPAYQLNTHVQSKHASIETGAAALPIPMPYYDSWIDVDSNFTYQAEVDQYIDLNNNGKFDPLYLAGFQAPRPASQMHDPITAQALVIKVGNAKLGLLVFDLIGLSNDEVIRLQKQARKNFQIHHLQVICTHNHQGPDVIGIWGIPGIKSGVHKSLMDSIRHTGLHALQLADASLQTSKIHFAKTDAAKDMVIDTRLPVVKDDEIYLMQSRNLYTDEIIATFCSWGNHVETVGRNNTALSSDFVHYWRQAMVNGNEEHTKSTEGGGLAIFVPGAVGGLMTTNADVGILNPNTPDQVIHEPSFDKAKWQGQQLAKICKKALSENTETPLTHTSLSILAQSVSLPLENRELFMAAALGIIDRGMPALGKVRSEISLWQLGPASFLHLPGEIYPEIVNGGIEMPTGHDLGNDLVEIPSLRSAMPGDYPWVIGMTNDMIGYIIPYTQWDVTAPYTYGATQGPYGEKLSLGPETAPILHRSLLTLIAESEDNTAVH